MVMILMFTNLAIDDLQGAAHSRALHRAPGRGWLGVPQALGYRWFLGVNHGKTMVQ